MIEGRSENFCNNFCGTHFFNPPRYLKLLEIIPSNKTKKYLINFLLSYGEKFLGKTTVLCKDTPAFIANRIGIAGIASLFKIIEDLELSIEEVDSLTGPIIGRPKSATFRTCDLVGLDTLNNVAKGVYENCPNDENRHIFKLPDYINKMLKEQYLGDKTKQGFYKKIRDEKGKRQILLSLNLKNLKYENKNKVRFELIGKAKKISKLKDRLKILVNGNDKASLFYKKMFAIMFSYVSNRVPEISNEIYKIDAAMCAGFGWELGPFEIWDAIGIQKGIDLIKQEN